MPNPRLFLVAPPEKPGSEILACVSRAAKAGDCASILVSEGIGEESIKVLQALGLAVILRDCEPRAVHRLGADGMQLSRSAPVKAIREILTAENIGVFAATSRHIAMEAAEAGADYVAFAQKSHRGEEPLIQWWQDIFEIPAVAFDPVQPADLAILLPQQPDFIRPSDAMWQSEESAEMVVKALTEAMNG
jgi:thiamine-phosphate pyrophosphorylase